MPTLTDAYESVAQSLRTFGYPDVTSGMIREIHEAMGHGVVETELPHGIIGRFAFSQLNEHADLLAKLKD